MPGPLTRAAEEIEDRVEAAEEAAAEAAETNHDTPPPQPDHSADLDLGQRIGRLEEAQKAPVQDPRVDGLMERFDGIMDRLGEALSDSVSEVEEVTPEPVAEAAGQVLEPVEQAPKRVHAFLRRLW